MRDVRLSAEIEVDGCDIPEPAWQADSWYAAPKGQPSKADFAKLLGYAVPEPPPPRKGGFTMESTILEMSRHSLVNKIVLHFMKKPLPEATAEKPIFAIRRSGWRFPPLRTAPCLVWQYALAVPCRKTLRGA